MLPPSLSSEEYPWDRLIRDCRKNSKKQQDEATNENIDQELNSDTIERELGACCREDVVTCTSTPLSESNDEQWFSADDIMSVAS